MNFLSKNSSNRNLSSKNRRMGDYDLLKNFDDFFNRGVEDYYDPSITTFLPLVNIEETADAYNVEAEIPGVKKEDIDVSVKDDYLVLKGEKKGFNEEKKDKYHRVERSFGSFYRTIALPSDIDKEKVNAVLKDGILHVQIKKSQNIDVSAKKITIH